MPRVTEAWKNNPDRIRYYKARAEKLEAENRRERARYIEVGQLNRDLKAFFGAIAAKIKTSKLDLQLRTEIADDIRDQLHKMLNRQESGNGPNGQASTTHRSRARGRK